MLFVVDNQGFIIARGKPIGGNHNDNFAFARDYKFIFAQLKKLSQFREKIVFCADASFDSKANRKILWNNNFLPNIAENKRGRKKPKRGRKRYFDREKYNQRYKCERSFAWIDRFKALLIRYERKSELFLGLHFLAFSLINLRDIVKV